MAVVINEMELQQEAPPAPPPPRPAGAVGDGDATGADSLRAAWRELQWRTTRLAAD